MIQNPGAYGVARVSTVLNGEVETGIVKMNTLPYVYSGVF